MQLASFSVSCALLISFALWQGGEAGWLKKFGKRVENAVKKTKFCTPGGFCVERGKHSSVSPSQAAVSTQSQCQLPSLLLSNKLHLLHFNLSLSFDEPEFRGNFSIRNGMLEGLPSLPYTYILSEPQGVQNGIFELKANFSRLTVFGDYEVSNWQISGKPITTFSGMGPLNITLLRVILSSLFDVVVNSANQEVQLGQHYSVACNYAEGFASGGNLFLDRKPVHHLITDSKNNRFEGILLREILGKVMMSQINRHLQGCTFKDLNPVLRSWTATNPSLKVM